MVDPDIKPLVGFFSYKEKFNQTDDWMLYPISSASTCRR